MGQARPTAVWVCAFALAAVLLAASGADLCGFGATLRAGLSTALAMAQSVPGAEHFPFADWIHPLARPFFDWLPTVLVSAAGAALTALLFSRVGWSAAAGAAALLLALGLALSWWIYARYGLFCDTAGFAVAMAGAYGGALIGGAYARHAVRERIADVFDGALSPSVVRRIARAPDLVGWGGETQNVTMLFCTLRMPPDEALKESRSYSDRLNRAQTALTDEILSRGGKLDCVAGGFAAYWNVPLRDPNHARHACEAACAMMKVQKRLNETMAMVDTGIGLASGPVIAGGYTRGGRLHYGIAGACALLAARMQRISIRYGAQVLVSEETRKAAGDDFAFLDVDYRVIEPGGDPVRLYVLLGDAGVRASPKFRAVETFHARIAMAIRTRQWQEARALIAQCRRLSGAVDGVYDMHLRRLDYFEKHPPADDWDGAFRAPLV